MCVNLCGHKALELVQELAEYLAVRYPSTFRLKRHLESDAANKSFVEAGWGGAPPVKSVTIVPLRVTYELNENAEDMMKVAALLLVHLLATVRLWHGTDIYLQSSR